MKTLILILAVISYPLLAICQTVRVTNITGQAQVTGNISPDEARKEALDDAKLNALKGAGIEEKISCYQSLSTDQVNDNDNQSFQSHIQSDMLGAVKFDTIISEGMVRDSNSNVFYRVRINALVTTYLSDPLTTVSTGKIINKPASPDNKNECYYFNGDTYSGQLHGSKRNGYGTYVWANGSQYTGYYKNGLRNGPGVYYGSNGKILSGFWTNDRFTQYQIFPSGQTAYTQRSHINTNSSGTGMQANVAQPSPQNKLNNDQNNFAQQVEAEQQKIQ
jgi:hypothetical protein